MCKVISKELLKARERRTVCQWSYILCDCLQCLFNGKWLWLLENYDGGGFLLMWKQSSHLLWQSKSNTPVHIIVMITALPSRSLISRSGKIPVTLAHKNCRASKGNTDCSHCTDSQLAARIQLNFWNGLPQYFPKLPVKQYSSVNTIISYWANSGNTLT